MSAIISTLNAHGIVGAAIVAEHRGSAVVRYDLQLLPGTRVDAVQRLSAELAMATSSRAVRIAPVSGTPYLGIEVPADDRPIVEVVGQPEGAPPLSFHVGNGTDGAPVHVNLAKAPHLLIAGATNSGKSVGLVSCVSQLMENNPPSRLRALMADPKRVELAGFANSPHLAAPVATEVADILAMLQYAVEEMDLRYTELQRLGARNVESVTAGIPFPYLIVVIDEIADLMVTTKGAAEAPIVRLAQLGRAAGIHLIMATQHPKAEVVTSLISANIPTRLVFAVQTHAQSKVALGSTGAETLLGSGDALLQLAGAPNVVRILSCYRTDAEIQAAAESWGAVDPDERELTPEPEVEDVTRPFAEADISAHVAAVEETARTFAEHTDVTAVQHAVDAVAQYNAPPVEHHLPIATAPDGTPMFVGDRVCYLCGFHRAVPGTTVCVAADCDDLPPARRQPDYVAPVVENYLREQATPRELRAAQRAQRRAARAFRKASR